MKFLKAPETEKMVKSLQNNNDIYLVPAFTGLDNVEIANAREFLSGITRITSPKK